MAASSRVQAHGLDRVLEIQRRKDRRAVRHVLRERHRRQLGRQVDRHPDPLQPKRGEAQKGARPRVAEADVVLERRADPEVDGCQVVRRVEGIGPAPHDDLLAEPQIERTQVGVDVGLAQLDHRPLRLIALQAVAHARLGEAVPVSALRRPQREIELAVTGLELGRVGAGDLAGEHVAPDVTRERERRRNRLAAARDRRGGGEALLEQAAARLRRRRFRGRRIDATVGRRPPAAGAVGYRRRRRGSRRGIAPPSTSARATPAPAQHDHSPVAATNAGRPHPLG